MQHDHTDRQLALVEIGRWRVVDHGTVPTRAVRIVTMATPTMAILPPSSISMVVGVPKYKPATNTEMTGAASVSGVTVDTGWRCNSHDIAPCPSTVEPTAEKAMAPIAAIGMCGMARIAVGSKTSPRQPSTIEPQKPIQAKM